MTNQQSVNWITVLSFLQKQQMQSTIKQKQWNLQRHQLLDKINRLQSQLDSNRIIITDLLNRIKILQIALFQSKINNSKNNQTINKNGNFKQKDLQIQNLLEKFKLDTKIKEDDHQQFLTQILSQIGIDSKQILPKDSVLDNQSNFLYKKQNNALLHESGSFCAHLDGVRKLFINEGKDFVVTISQDCLVKLWTYPSVIKNKSQYLQPLKTFREHAGPLFALTGGSNPFYPQQSIFFTGGSDGLIKYWKVKNKNLNQLSIPITSWNCSKQVDKDSIIWDLSLNNNKLLSSASDGFVNLYQITQNQGNKLKYQFKQKQFHPTCLQWISQQTFIQGCSNAPRAQVWDIEGKIKLKYLYQIPKGSQAQQFQINDISYNKSLKIASFGCQDGAIRLFTTNFNKMIRKLQLNSSVSCVREVKDWQVVCGTHSGGISVWDLRNYQMIQEFNKSHAVKYDQGVLCLWSQQDKIFSGGADGFIKIYS